MKRIVAFLLVILVTLGALPLQVAGAEDPRFEATVPEPELQPGVEQELTVQLVNDAEDPEDTVKTATNVRVEASGGSTPFSVVSGQRLIGDMTDGVPTTVALRVEVPNDAPGGTYDLPVTVTYEYDGDERETTTVTARVRVPERPIFTITDVESDLFQDETGLVTVTMRNDGSLPAESTTVAVTARSQALLVGESQGTEVFVGSLAAGATKRFSVPVTSNDVVGGDSYTLQLLPTYQDENDISTRAPPKSIGVTPKDGTRFEITDVDSSVAVGESGSLRIAVRNAGDSVVRDATIALESGAPGLTFEGQPSTSRFVDDWAPGEVRTIRTDVTATRAAEPGDRTIAASISFKHDQGVRSNSGPYEVPVTVQAEQTFSYSDVELDLRGSTGVLTATITNEGHRAAEDVTVLLESGSPAVQVVEPAAPVGNLGPGESTTIGFDLQVNTGATPGVRQFDATVRYSRDEDATYVSDPVAIRANFPTDEDLFTVEPVNATFGIDADNEFQVRIRNDGDEPLSDVRAQLEVTPPYETQSPSAYIGHLDPGEATVVTFHVTTPDDAVPTTDALSVNLSAETEESRHVVAGPYLVPFTIEAAGATASDTTALAVGAVVVIVILGAGWWWLNR